MLRNAIAYFSIKYFYTIHHYSYINNGLFITIEGLDGAGKTTQAQILYQYFIDLGIKCILTKEPSPLTFKRYEDTADKRSIAQIVRGIVYSKVGVDPIVI